MLRGGFNWIFFGLIIDIILEWKPTWIVMLGDARLEGWINMVPDDVVFMIASFFVLTGCFLFVALLWFLLMPQSVSLVSREPDAVESRRAEHAPALPPTPLKLREAA